MCLSCGCGNPYDDHGDSRNITQQSLVSAGHTAAMSGSVNDVMHNINGTLEDAPQDKGWLRNAPTLVFDIDGVLAFECQSAYTLLNAQFNTNFIYGSYAHHHLELTPDQHEYLHNAKEAESYWINISPDLSGIRAVKVFAKAGYEIVVATDRHPQVSGATKTWLNMWSVPYDQLEVGKGHKEALAVQHGPSDPAVFFDDNPSKILTIPKPGVTLYMPQRAWTPDVDRPNVKVFTDWGSVIQELDAS